MEAVKFPTEVEEFFANNPEATDCFVALGYVRATREEAEKILAGVKGHMPMRYVREAGLMHQKSSDAILEQVIIFEGEEQKYHEAFDLEATDDNMKKWKEAQASLVKAKGEYDIALAEEKKLAAEKNKAEGEETGSGDAEMISHVVTEEDLAENPELATTGVKVGDTIQIPAPEKTEE